MNQYTMDLFLVTHTQGEGEIKAKVRDLLSYNVGGTFFGFEIRFINDDDAGSAVVRVTTAQQHSANAIVSRLAAWHKRAPDELVWWYAPAPGEPPETPRSHLVNMLLQYRDDPVNANLNSVVDALAEFIDDKALQMYRGVLKEIDIEKVMAGTAPWHPNG